MVKRVSGMKEGAFPTIWYLKSSQQLLHCGACGYGKGLLALKVVDLLLNVGYYFLIV